MPKPDATALRLLLACKACKRQYDATGLEAGSRFRCSCGELIDVPRFRVRDSQVVRCSACGAARQGDSATCAHCGAGFTLLEREQYTICPSCMTRIANSARFCHSCGTGIAAGVSAGQGTEHPCPSCGERERLHSRALGQPPLSLLECPSCAGMWLDWRTFEAALGRARSAALAEPVPGAADAATEGFDSRPVYRRCPLCAQMMHRRNFGKTSGVILDSCRKHGLWFDATELERVLRWVRAGGESETKRREEEDERRARWKARLDRAVRPVEGEGRAPGGDAAGAAGALNVLIAALFRS